MTATVASLPCPVSPPRRSLTLSILETRMRSANSINCCHFCCPGDNLLSLQRPTVIWIQPVVTILIQMFCCLYSYPDVWRQPVVSDINKREVGVLSAVSGSESPATEKVVCSGLIYHTHKQKPQFHDTIKSSFLPKLIY